MPDSSLSRESIDQIVAHVVASAPLPADYRELDPLTQQRVERQALAIGVDADQYWANERAESVADTERAIEAERVATAARVRH